MQPSWRLKTTMAIGRMRSRQKLVSLLTASGIRVVRFQCFDERRDCVRRRFYIDSKAMPARRLGRNRPDTGDEHTLQPLEVVAEKGFQVSYRRGRCEGGRVDLAVAQYLQRLCIDAGGDLALVQRDLVHDGASGFQGALEVDASCGTG